MHSLRDDILTIILVILLAFLVTSCQPAATVEPEVVEVTTATIVPSAPLPIPGAAPDTSTPAGVVEAFYSAYLENEPPVALQDSPYLSDRLIAAVTAAREAGPMGADPFLLAQTTPAAIRVEPVASGETTARVVLRQMMSLDPADERSHDLTLDLVRAQAGWQIDAIQTGNPMTPDGVVELFYNWYLREGAGAAYGESLYLAPAFIAEIDARDAAGELAYDPFLRDENWPRSFFIMRHEMQVAGDEASIPVQLHYGQETRLITISVVRQPAQWRVAGVAGEMPDEATSAREVVALFVDGYFQQWYAYAEEQGLPHTGDVNLTAFLVDVAPFFAESPYLTASFAASAAREKVNAEAPEDPIFLADGVPARMDIESAWVDGDHAEVRVIQRWMNGEDGHRDRALTVTLARVEGRWRIDGVVVADAAIASEEATPEASMHPAAVVRAFLTTYLQQGGYAGGGHLHHDYLAEWLVEMLAAEADHYRTLEIPVDEIDPLLYTSAAVVPAGLSVEVGEVTILENEVIAYAHVERLFRESGISLPLQITLARDGDNRWRIQQIDPVNPQIGGDPASDEMSLAAHMALYYKWALGYAASSEEADQVIDALRFEMEAPGGLTFCSETWPDGFAVESAFIEPEGAHAWVAIRTSEPHALLTLILEKREWYWVVVDQQCGDSPAGRALAFYTHYSGYAGDPWAARAYGEGDFLTADLIQRLDTQMAAGEADPFRPRAGAPRWFAVTEEPGGNSAVVAMTAADGSTGEVRLTFVLVDGRWLISGVADGTP
jgi:hypothetical protein